VGGVLGLMIAFAGTAALKRYPNANIPRLDHVTVDYSVLLFTLLLSTVAGLVFGISPAFRFSGLQDSLKAGGRMEGLGTRSRMLNVMVISEIALAVTLLVGAGLLFKSFSRLQQVRPGFNPERVLTAAVVLPPTRYREPEKQTQFVGRLLEGLEAVPDLRQTAASAGLPFANITDVGITFEGRQGADSGTTANYYRVSASYLQVMEIPLIHGRFFNERDLSTGSPVVVINETMAKRFFPNEDPIGKRLDISGPTFFREIVGIVGDVKQTGLKISVPPQVYEPILQKPSNAFYIVARTPGDPERLADALRRVVQSVDKDQPIFNVRTMETMVSRSVTQDRFAVFVLGLFAALAVMLALIGVYGIIAYTVGRRRREVGLRIALGAQPSGVKAMFLRRGLVLTVTGAVIGLAGAVGLSRFLSALLFDVRPLDPTAYVAAGTVLLVAAAVASYIPARRAARVDPMEALRSE